MPSGLSETAVYNMALDYLDEEVATSPDDDRGPVRWLKRNFGPTRDALLEIHPWDFALARISVPANAVGPAFGWKYAYPEPADAIRVLPLQVNGDLNGRPIAHEIEGGQILTDAAAPLLVRYIKRVSNPALFTPLFADLLATRLAWKMSNWLTGKSSYTDRLSIAQKELLSAARLSMALTGTAPEPVDDDWILARSR